MMRTPLEKLRSSVAELDLTLPVPPFIDDLLPAQKPPRRPSAFAAAVFHLRRFIGLCAAAVVAFSLVAGAWFALQERAADRDAILKPVAVVHSVNIPFPVERPLGLAAMKGKYYTFASGAGQLAHLDPARPAVADAIPFPNASVGGLSGGGESLWSTDPSLHRLHRHDPTTGVILQAFPAPGGQPGPILWSGDAIWTADGSGVVFRHDAKTLKALESHKVSLERPTALARVGDHLWVAVERSRLIQRFRVTSGWAFDGYADLSAVLPPTADRLAGMAVDDDGVWFLTDAPPVLRRVPKRDIRFQSP